MANPKKPHTPYRFPVRQHRRFQVRTLLLILLGVQWVVAYWVHAQDFEHSAKYQELKKEALAIYSQYKDTGGPIRNLHPRNQADIYETAAAARLGGISAYLGRKAPERFLKGADRENIARLIEDVPGEGQALALLIRTRRNGEHFQERLNAWLGAREGKVVVLSPEAATLAVKGEHPTGGPPERHKWIPRKATEADILEATLKIYSDYSETGGPRYFVGSTASLDEKSLEERRAGAILNQMNHKLSQLDPLRFEENHGRENLALLLENAPGDGPALAALIRTRRQMTPALHAERLAAWQQALAERKALDCLLSLPGKTLEQ